MGMMSYAVDIVACRDSRADIAFVLDASGSIIYRGKHMTADYANWNLMKAFVITLIRSLKVSRNDTRVALVRFSHQSSIVFKLDDYNTVDEAVQVTSYTCIRLHLYRSVSEHFPLLPRRTLIFLDPRLLPL